MPSEVRWIHSNASRIFYCNPEIGQVAALRPLHEVAHRIRNTSRNLHRNLQKNARTFLSYSTGGQKEVRQNLTKEICLFTNPPNQSAPRIVKTDATISSSLEAGPFAKEPTNQRRIPNRADTQNHLINQDQPNHLLPHSTNQNQISIAHHSVADHFTIMPST